MKSVYPSLLLLSTLVVTFYPFVQPSQVVPAAELRKIVGERYSSDEDFYRFWKRYVLRKVIGDHRLENVRNWLNKSALLKPIGTNFDCKSIPMSSSKPSSVHQLKPSDIDVVAALGDSMTTGFAARSNNLMDFFVDYRGVAWSIGGDQGLETVTTLPNILQKYNPNLIGYSSEFMPPLERRGSLIRLNMAQTDAITDDLRSQADRLIDKMRDSMFIDYKRDWKLLTIMTGTKDLCHMCKNSDYSPSGYVRTLKRTLDRLQEEVPRMFVNLVQVYDVTELNKLHSPYCDIFYETLCPCATVSGRLEREKVKHAVKEYHRLTKELIKSGRYNIKKDFTVVIQPFFLNWSIPKINGSMDESYFAPDCFHFSVKGHAATSKALWENMFEPVGEKDNGSKMEDNLRGSLECPKDIFPFIFTEVNSVVYKEMKKKAEQTKNNETSTSTKYTNITEAKASSQMKIYKKFIKEFTEIYRDMIKNFTSTMVDVFKKFGEEMKKFNTSQGFLKLHQNTTMLNYQKMILRYLEQFANFSKYIQSAEKFMSQYANGTQYKKYMEKYIKQYMNDSYIKIAEKYITQYMSNSSSYGGQKIFTDKYKKQYASGRDYMKPGDKYKSMYGNGSDYKLADKYKGMFTNGTDYKKYGDRYKNMYANNTVYKKFGDVYKSKHASAIDYKTYDDKYKKYGGGSGKKTGTGGTENKGGAKETDYTKYAEKYMKGQSTNTTAGTHYQQQQQPTTRLESKTFDPDYKNKFGDKYKEQWGKLPKSNSKSKSAPDKNNKYGGPYIPMKSSESHGKESSSHGGAVVIASVTGVVVALTVLILGVCFVFWKRKQSVGILQGSEDHRTYETIV